METANEEITSLIKSYYKALGDKDIATLRTLVDNLAPSDESKITNAKYIEGYEAGDIYTKKGLDDDSYVVYSCFYYICQGIDTKVPALAEFYVVKDTDGNWKIDGAVHDDSDEITIKKIRRPSKTRHSAHIQSFLVFCSSFFSIISAHSQLQNAIPASNSKYAAPPHA